jgi:hypothetical protein
MREEPLPGERKGQGRGLTGTLSDSAGLNPGSSNPGSSNLERRFRWALALYAVLAVLVWFTMDAGKVFVFGKPVELRLLPLVVIGGMAVRTVLAWQAEKIRRSGQASDEGGSQTPGS